MIDLASTFRISIRALLSNKMRSGLTMLGIIIGVAAVIAMLALGNAARKRITDQIASMGSNLLIVLPGATTSGGMRMGAGTQMTLNISDAEAIQRESPAVQSVAPSLNGALQVVYGNQNWSTMVFGTTPSILEIRDWSISAGRAFTEDDVKSSSKVCMIGKTVALNLFGPANPVGQAIRIKQIPFTVLGMLSEKGQNAMGQDQDDLIIVPVSTAQKMLFGTTVPGMVRVILVKAKGAEELQNAERQITELLRQRHRIGPRQEEDFSVRNLTQMMQAAEQSTKVMTLLLGAIASVSLIVGGIGVMNIMLVSVTERTREIGIRMAVGAKLMDIRVQFIIEAVTLSLIGGILGILAGVAASYALSAVSGWDIEISTFSVVLSFGFSGLVGVFFGYYPAYKASLLDPIDALRYE